MRSRLCFQPYGAIYSTKEPPVRLALGSVDGLVVRVLLYTNFNLIVASEFQQIGDVIREAIEASLMYGACGLAIDEDFGISHYATKPEAYILSLPVAGNTERALISTFFHRRILHSGFLIPTAIGIFTEALQFPL